MVIFRRPLSNWAPLLRSRSSAATRSWTGRQVLSKARTRGYATGSGHEAKKGGDMQWALISGVTTVGICSWIGIYQPSKDGHGHEHGHEDGEDHKEEEPDKEESQDTNEELNKDEPSEEGGDAKAEETADESDSDSGDKDQETPETSDDEDSKTSEKDADDRKEDDDGKNRTVKYQDAKGGVKSRKESKAGKKLGEANEDDNTEGDQGKTAKQAAGGVTSGSTSGKQEGLSNTDTKHSYDLDNDHSKSKKSEGGPDTAKAKGTISPNRAGV